jgi:phosphosulfolactate synthase
MSQTFQEYLGIQWPSRSQRPRKEGLTMVMDTGWPTSFVDSQMDQYGEYFDVVKIWDPQLRAPEKEIRRKIEVYKAHKVRVQPGGIFMEIARIQGAEENVMRKLADIGFDVLEVSGTETNAERDMRKEGDFVKRATDLGFAVFGEVGKNFSERDQTRRSDEVVNDEVTVKEMLSLLDAGAERVCWEGHLLRRVMGESAEDLLAKRETGTQQAVRFAQEVGQARIIFRRAEEPTSWAGLSHPTLPTSSASRPWSTITAARAAYSARNSRPKRIPTDPMDCPATIHSRCAWKLEPGALLAVRDFSLASRGGVHKLLVCSMH